MDPLTTHQGEPRNSAPVTAESGRAARIFQRIFTRHTMNLALLLMLPMLLAPALNTELTLMVDPDIWWHLANARIL
ncbi:MAG TPA: hypothetical protein VFI20_02780, partial [Terracidiphilus sp.]|nr:hypothetical protein [Terracidiphilus sp.]